MDDHEEPGFFAGLPAELLLMIMKHCDKPDIATLSRFKKDITASEDLSSSETLVSAFTIVAKYRVPFSVSVQMDTSTLPAQ